MKRIILLFVFLNSLFFATVLIAQTGPGGVGNSSTNVLWLKPDVITSLTDGTNITSWADVSGNTNNFSQADTSLAPIYKTNILNGQPVVRFTKTNGRIRKINFTDFPTSEITEIYVNKTTESNDGVLSYASSSHNNDFLIFSSNNLRIYRGGHTSSGVSSNDNNFHIINASWRSIDGKEELWKDGTSSYSGTGHSTGSNITAGGSLAIAGEQDAVDGSYAASQDHLGDFGEVIIFNTYLDSAKHIIISNYLSAKYGLSLASNDVYNEDDVVNGNYDFDVAGIGRVDASNLHNDAQGSSMVRVSNPTGLGDDEFLIWGHDNGVAQATNIVDVPGTVQARFDRVWRVSEVDASGVAVDVGDINMRWDLSNLGPITASDLRLLIDTDNDATFADELPIAGATNLGGNIYQFTAVPGGITGITDNRRFTIGTINLLQTPLPVDLISFNAHVNEGKVDLKWITATEINNDYFTIEKSTNGKEWEEILVVNGAGNSSQIIEYFDVDYEPLIGVSYYRLKQTDFDGRYTYSNVVPVTIENNRKNSMNVYPNPVEIGGVVSIDFQDYEKEVLLVLRDAKGKEFYSKFFLNIEKGQLIGIPISETIPAGIYLITATSENKIYSKKLIIN